MLKINGTWPYIIYRIRMGNLWWYRKGALLVPKMCLLMEEMYYTGKVGSPVTADGGLSKSKLKIGFQLKYSVVDLVL